MVTYKEEERKARTHRLIVIGGVVASVLGRDFVDGDDMRLLNFLKQQERNGNYFSIAMNKGSAGYGEERNCKRY